MIVKFPERWTTLRKLIFLQLLGSGGGASNKVGAAIVGTAKAA